MNNYVFSGNPRLIGYQLTESMYGYLSRALDLGALEGPLGDMKPTPELAAVLQAANAILAGGKVKIEIESRGNPDIFNELNRRLESAGKDANSINKAAGFYVTAGV
jgi:hypothetical protein